MGRVLRVTFIDVKSDAEGCPPDRKITELAQEICGSKEHNLIIEELTAYVITPKPTPTMPEAADYTETKEI